LMGATTGGAHRCKPRRDGDQVRCSSAASAHGRNWHKGEDFGSATNLLGDSSRTLSALTPKKACLRTDLPQLWIIFFEIEHLSEGPEQGICHSSSKPKIQPSAIQVSAKQSLRRVCCGTHIHDINSILQSEFNHLDPVDEIKVELSSSRVLHANIPSNNAIASHQENLEAHHLLTIPA